MNVLYAKCILYSYSSLEAVMDQIDELVEKKALASMSDTSPAYFQCEKIVLFTMQKDLLIETKRTVDKILERLTDYERECLDYKYFKSKPKTEYVGIDTTCRSYFRKQIKLAEIFADRLERAGIDDSRFENVFLKIDFFRELLRRVYEYENVCVKNGQSFRKKKTQKVVSIRKVG